MSAVPPPERPAVRVTVGQLRVSDDHAANRAVVRGAFDTAARARADVLVLPEYASGFDPRGTGPEHAEPLDGPFVTLLRERAAADRTTTTSHGAAARTPTTAQIDSDVRHPSRSATGTASRAGSAVLNDIVTE